MIRINIILIRLKTKKGEKIMKKILSLALALAMMVSAAALTACGEDATDTTGAPANSSTPASSDPAATSGEPAQSQGGDTTDPTDPAETSGDTQNPQPTQGGETVYHPYEEVDNLDAWKADKTNLTEEFYDKMVAEHSQFTGFDYTGEDVGDIPEAGSHELASNLFDCNPDTKWCSGSNAVEFYASIVWQMDRAVHVVGYTMTTGNDNTKYTDRNPISWRLYGATELPAATMMDDDPNTGFSYLDSETVPAGWTLIDAVDSAYEDDVYSSQLPDMDKFEVGMNVANPGTYQYFLLLIDYCEGGTFQLGDFTLYGSEA